MGNPAEIAHGPIFIGFVFNVVVYGITLTQTLLYFQTFPRDRKLLKGLVAFLLLADTVNAVFDAVYLYGSLVIHYGDVGSLLRANWIFATDPALTGIVASVVQLFFAWRVKTLAGNILVFIVIVSTSVAGFLGAIGTAIAVGRVPLFLEFQKFKAIVIVWLAGAAVCDVLITCAFVWHLRKHKSGFVAADSVVNRVIRLTVQTGTVTSLCATLDLVLFLVNPNGLHLIFNIPLSKLYTNALLSNLNWRHRWNSNRSTSEPSKQPKPAAPVHLNELNGVSDVRGSRGATIKMKPHPSRTEVFINVESHELHDSDPKGVNTLALGEHYLSQDNSHPAHKGDPQWESKSEMSV